MIDTSDIPDELADSDWEDVLIWKGKAELHSMGFPWSIWDYWAARDIATHEPTPLREVARQTDVEFGSLRQPRRRGILRRLLA